MWNLRMRLAEGKHPPDPTLGILLYQSKRRANTMIQSPPAQWQRFALSSQVEGGAGREVFWGPKSLGRRAWEFPGAGSWAQG